MSDWFASNVPVAQFLSSTVFAIASGTIAYVAVRIGYRNAMGWKPVILANDPSMGELREPGGVFVGVYFEVWNRQKYPIVIRQMRVRLPGLHLLKTLPKMTPEDDGWLVTGGNSLLQRYGEITLDPNDHRKVVLHVQFDAMGNYEQWPPLFAVVKVQYFDPIRNKTLILEQNTKRSAPEIDDWKW